DLSRADPARATPLFTPALCDGSFPCRLSPHHKRLGNCALGCEVGKIRAPTRAGIFSCLLGKGQARKLKLLGTALAGSCMARIGLAHAWWRDFMKTVYSPLHAGHGGTMELVAGEIVPGFEKPSRAEIIRARVESEKLGPVLPPRPHDLTAAKRIHRADYIDFLPTVYPAWEASGRTGSALPFTWPTRGLRGDVPPETI